MRIKLALICAFFMSFFGHSIESQDLKAAKYTHRYTSVVNGGYVVSHWTDMKATATGDNGKEACGLVLNKIEGADFTTSNYDWVWRSWYSRFCSDSGSGSGRYTIKRCTTYNYGVCSSWTNETVTTSVTGIVEPDVPSCPPESWPDYKDLVQTSNGNYMCQKPPVSVDDENNDNACPSMGSFSTPELAFSANSSTQMCFPNPNNPSGETCKYNSETGVFQLPPNLGESVNCETGNPDNPFPDNPDDTNTPDENGCLIKMGQKYCSAKEEDNCSLANAAVKVGDTFQGVLTCNAGCGDIDDKFYCPEVPKDDQEPEINDNCTDEVFRLANPSVCSGKTDDSTDKNGDGQTDNADVVKGLNTGNQLAESSLSELKQGNAAQLAEQQKLNEKSFATNQLLSSLNNQVSETNKQLKSIKDDLSKPLEKGEKGSFDIATAQSELDTLKGEYQLKVDSIKLEASNLIQKLNAGGGSFDSCHEITSMNGKVETRCLSQFSDEMSIISNAILAFFTIVAGFIVLGGVTKND